MKDVVVIGAGKIGASVAGLLASTGDYQVTLADRSPEILASRDHAPSESGASSVAIPAKRQPSVSRRSTHTIS
jgi:saccharopine dehydrogenase-like NADP-dependent oxidoreductase